MREIKEAAGTIPRAPSEDRDQNETSERLIPTPSFMLIGANSSLRYKTNQNKAEPLRWKRAHLITACTSQPGNLH